MHNNKYRSFYFLRVNCFIVLTTIFVLCSSKGKHSQLEINDTINFNLPNAQIMSEKMRSIALEEMRLLIVGKRDCKSISNYINKNMAQLKYSYNKRLRIVHSNLAGWIGFKFTILGQGKVINCSVVETTVDDKPIHDTLLTIISNWEFNNIGDNADTTYVYFPFCCGSFCGSYYSISCNGVITKIEN